MVKTIRAKAKEQSAHFDTTQTGQVHVTVSEPDGTPLQDLGLHVSRDVGRTQFVVCNIPRETEFRKRAVDVLKMFTEGEHGTMIVSGLGAGSYTVAVTNGEWTEKRKVEVRTSSSTACKIQLNGEGQALDVR